LVLPPQGGVAYCWPAQQRWRFQPTFARRGRYSSSSCFSDSLKIHPTPIERHSCRPRPRECGRKITASSYEQPISLSPHGIHWCSVDQCHDRGTVRGNADIQPACIHSHHAHRTLRRVRALRIWTKDPSYRRRTIIRWSDSYTSRRRLLVSWLVGSKARNACNRKHRGKQHLLHGMAPASILVGI
jgi:hypothetical protein